MDIVWRRKNNLILIAMAQQHKINGWKSSGGALSSLEPKTKRFGQIGHRQRVRMKVGNEDLAVGQGAEEISIL